MMDGQTNIWTDGQTEGQTDESDFIRHCLTNVEHPVLNRNGKTGQKWANEEISIFSIV